MILTFPRLKAEDSQGLCRESLTALPEPDKLAQGPRTGALHSYSPNITQRIEPSTP